MPDLYDNPMGLDGFEFVEFASPRPDDLAKVFHVLGFEAVARHRSKDVTLYLVTLTPIASAASSSSRIEISAHPISE